MKVSGIGAYQHSDRVDERVIEGITGNGKVTLL
mgnify:CR=1 FL=1